MALTAAQIAARQGKLTASGVGALVNGDKARILELWKELVGDPSYVAPDFSDNWPVQLGSATEQLNLDWYEKKTGRTLTRRGDVVVHPDYDWAAATLDGYDAVLGGPVETKHVGGWEKTETVIQRYMPQLHWQMEVTKSHQCAISIIQGAAEPYIEVIPFDKTYADELMSRAHRFMQHVTLMTAPVTIEPPQLSPTYTAMREVNMAGNNTFADAATEWISNKKAAKDFKDAEKTLKEMLPHDAKRAFGYFINVTRAKNGAVSIKPL